MKDIRGIDLFVWRTIMGDPSCMAEARTKIPLIEESGIPCFPSAHMLWLYDDKIRETFFLRRHGYPTPKTFISFDETEARTFATSARYPLVTKTHNGAAASGVMLLRSPQESLRLLDRIFCKQTILDKAIVKYFYYPRLRHGDFMLERRFRSRDNVARYAYFQEFVKTENDWRIATFGPNLLSVVKRWNRPNDFRASGSGLWEKVEANQLPVEACDLALEISNRHNFTSMSYDFLQGADGWVIGEISYTFPLIPAAFTTTLFRKIDGTYHRTEPIPIGIMHLQAALGGMGKHAIETEGVLKR